MALPSVAFTAMVMVLAPTLKAMAPEGLPDATVVPLTLIVAPVPGAVGVTVMDVFELGTAAVYCVIPDLNAGLKVPPLKVRPVRLALPLTFTTPVPVASLTLEEPELHTTLPE